MRLKRRVLPYFFFLRARESTYPRKLQHYRPKFAQPAFADCHPLASRFRVFFNVRVAKSELSRPSPSLPFHSLDESRSGAALPSCARTFKWRASTLKKAVPQPFVWRCERGKTRGSHAQFYGKPCRGLSRRRKEPREKEREDERGKSARMENDLLDDPRCGWEKRRERERGERCAYEGGWANVRMWANRAESARIKYNSWLGEIKRGYSHKRRYPNKIDNLGYCIYFSQTMYLHTCVS